MTPDILDFKQITVLLEIDFTNSMNRPLSLVIHKCLQTGVIGYVMFILNMLQKINIVNICAPRSSSEANCV